MQQQKQQKANLSLHMPRENSEHNSPVGEDPNKQTNGVELLPDCENS